jgi:ferredoxin
VRVSVDGDLCFGHGRCYTLAPELFRDDDAGNGQVKEDGTVSQKDTALARRAVRECPEHAITVTE